MSGDTVQVKVVEGCAVFDGTAQRSGGAELAVPAHQAARWLANGWVVRVEPKSRKRST